MHWLTLLFMHWRVPAGALRALIPSHFEIDTFDGTAWVGLIPFTMRHVRPTCLPSIPIRGVSHLHECNVRTYVTYKGEPGVWFFSLDAESRLAVILARQFFALNYLHASIALARSGDDVDYEVERLDEPKAGMRCAWRIGAELPLSLPGELAFFLTERYCFLTVDARGRPCRCRIWHPRWSLREANVLSLSDGLVAAAGIAVKDLPDSTLYSEHQRVHAWPLERLDG
jgi:uncharacterized protein YqjF (DUF2071 family)